MNLARSCFIAATACLLSSPALAAVRTYVASYGSDGNTGSNCGPTTPCRTFSAAMGVADSGGQVIVLDSAGYGSVVITKSISLIAPDGIYAGLTVADGGTAVDIATAGVDVVLRGLTIIGQGNGYGISMTNGNSLHLEKMVLANFSGGYGLYIQTYAKVHVIDSVIRDNVYGLRAGRGAIVDIIGSKMLNNISLGIEIYSSGASTGITTTVNISDTFVSSSQYCIADFEILGNKAIINAARAFATNCSRAFISSAAGTGTMTVAASMATNSGYGFSTAGTGTASLMVSDSVASKNTNGFHAETGTLTASGCTASGNDNGFAQIGGTFVSLGNNTVYGNTTNRTGTITPVALE
jgi:hypothetical protein